MSTYLEKAAATVWAGDYVECSIDVRVAYEGRRPLDCLTLNLENPKLRKLVASILDILAEEERDRGIEAMKESYRKFYGVEMPEPEGI